MVFIMRDSKSCKLGFLLGLLIWLLSAIVFAAEPISAVKQAHLTLEGDTYFLSADLDYHLSTKALHALQNGVSLFWIVQIKIEQQRDMLWNDTLIEKNIRYRLQYHALLNMYRVKNESSSEVYNFSTLAAALDKMSTLHNFPVIASKLIVDPKKNHYLAALRVIFNRNALPLPLRPMAYLNPQWYLSSDWYVWPLTK
jgi:hypothetical protein